MINNPLAECWEKDAKAAQAERDRLTAEVERLTRELAEARAELRETAAYCYQLAGAANEQVSVLNNLSALAVGSRITNAWDTCYPAGSGLAAREAAAERRGAEWMRHAASEIVGQIAELPLDRTEEKPATPEQIQIEGLRMAYATLSARFERVSHDLQAATRATAAREADAEKRMHQRCLNAVIGRRLAEHPHSSRMTMLETIIEILGKLPLDPPAQEAPDA